MSQARNLQVFTSNKKQTTEIQTRQYHNIKTLTGLNQQLERQIKSDIRREERYIEAAQNL